MDVSIKEVMSQRREKFHINIRKKYIEDVLSHTRRDYLLQAKTNVYQCQEISEKIHSKRPLSTTEMQQDLQVLCNCLITRKIQLTGSQIQETIENIAQLFYMLCDDDIEEIVQADGIVSQALGEIVWYSQGYRDSTYDSLQLVNSASRALKRIMSGGYQQYVVNLLLNFGMLETIFFLLGKEDQGLIKRGLQILFRCLQMFDEEITDKIFSTMVYSKDCKSQIMHLFSHQNSESKLHKRIQKCICYALMGSSKQLEFFVDQGIVGQFVQILLREADQPPPRVQLLNALRSISVHYDDEQDSTNIKQQMVIHRFREYLDRQLFSQIESVSRACQDLLSYIEE